MIIPTSLTTRQSAFVFLLRDGTADLAVDFFPEMLRLKNKKSRQLKSLPRLLVSAYAC